MHPLPPKDPPVRDVADFAPAARCSGLRRSWWRRAAGWTCGVALGLLLLAILLGPSGHGDGIRVLRVTARLVENASDASVEDARVVPLSSHDLATTRDPEEAWRWVHALNADGWNAEHQHGEAPLSTRQRWDREGTRSGRDGKVAMVVELWTSATKHLFWSSESAEEPEERVAALWIAREGRQPVVVRPEHPVLRLEKAGSPLQLWGTYDLGTVLVPMGEAGPR